MAKVTSKYEALVFSTIAELRQRLTEYEVRQLTQAPRVKALQKQYAALARKQMAIEAQMHEILRSLGVLGLTFDINESRADEDDPEPFITCRLKSEGRYGIRSGATPEELRQHTSIVAFEAGVQDVRLALIGGDVVVLKAALASLQATVARAVA